MTMTLGQIDAARSIASWKAPDRPVATLKPINASRLSGNELRPTTFAEMIGQTHLKPLLERLVVAAKSSGRPLDHCLLSGSAGTGKTTTAMVIAHELGRDIFMLKAPVNLELLEELAAVAKDGDVVFVDEVHQQMLPDRRGVGQPADPEVFYHILEDRQLVTSTTVIPFPDVTFIGATTDLGRLPEPFIMRFPLQPRLEAYTDAEMATLATANADSLELSIEPSAAMIFARASRATPRIVNRYVKNAQSFAAIHIDDALAVEIVTELNATALDGLDSSMCAMLRFLLKSRRKDKDGNSTYQASVGSIATALGFSRDQKRVALYVEPTLIERGYVDVGHGGRTLTNAGIQRARQL